MSDEKKNQNSENENKAGGCTKCTCPSFRGDSGNPERCVNIQPPSQKLCGHLKSEHK